MRTFTSPVSELVYESVVGNDVVYCQVLTTILGVQQLKVLDDLQVATWLICPDQLAVLLK